MEAGYTIEKDKDNVVAGLPIVTPQLFDTPDNLLSRITKMRKEQGAEPQPTNQKDTSFFTGSMEGVVSPVDVITARTLKDISPHHSSCIQAKKYSIMGMGFVSEGTDVQDKKVDATTPVNQVQQAMSDLLSGEAYVETKADKILNPLTLHGFAFELYRAVEDFLDAGTGYLEVVRGKDQKIVGINWLPYEDVNVAIIKDSNNRSRVVYKYYGGLGVTGNRYYSLFGLENRKWVFENIYNQPSKDNSTTTSSATLEDVSEVIPFMLPSNQTRYYGYPDWLSAGTIVTLLSRALQYKSDFYVNRGVLAYILSVCGQVDGPTWDTIKKLVQGSVGAGNNFRNLAVNVSDPNSKVQVDKLAASDKTEDQFAKDAETFAEHIVSAHRVPPILANILVAGKLGAANETVQAIIMFQLLNVGPMQTLIQGVLANTLGNQAKGGIAELKPEDLRLRKITSQINIQGLDAASRSRQEASAQPDRNFADGVKQ